MRIFWPSGLLIPSLVHDCLHSVHFDIHRQRMHQVIYTNFLHSEDGAADSPGASKAAAAAHKLGPKANQGAINAGLRALDRSGAPCRKWQKGSFKLKSFTGTTWEIPRWRAPPKVTINGQSEGSTSGSSGKENKENSQVDSERSNGIQEPDVASSNGIPASSPAPVISAAA